MEKRNGVVSKSRITSYWILGRAAPAIIQFLTDAIGHIRKIYQE